MKSSRSMHPMIALGLIAALVVTICPAPTVAQSNQPLRVVAFLSPTCEHCHEVELALPDIVAPFGDKVALEKHSIAGHVLEELIVYLDHYKLQASAPPVVFVGSRGLVGRDDIVKELQNVLKTELAAGSVTFTPATDASSSPAVLERFKSFTVGAVVVAGLIDGINPCAFTTIVFLLSMLAYFGKSRRQLAVCGVGFTSSVFATYFAMGLGALVAVKAFSVSSGLSAGLTYVVAGLTFALAGWSLVDFVRYVRSGNPGKMTLGLPKSVKARIHAVIRSGLKTRNLLIGSLTVGVLVAVLESICTGQLYLPTIVFVARSPGLCAHAVAYLLLYNLMFIAPLVVIMVMAYYGVQSKAVGDFVRRHLALSKLGLAILFAALGVLVLLTV